MDTQKIKKTIVNYYWQAYSLLVRHLFKVDSKKIICWAYNCDKYSDSPRVMTEYLLEKHGEEYKIYWVLVDNFDSTNINSKITIVKPRSTEYFRALYSSKFIINNRRSFRYLDFFFKKKSQRYIMTWHGSFPLKKIERDAKDVLTKAYVREAIHDSHMCDLMLSNSSFYTNIIKNSFWYNGEILEKGIPRNDIFYNQEYIGNSYKKVRENLGIEYNTKIVIYAPTFRANNKDLENYRINWGEVIPAFETFFNSRVKVLIRLHPYVSKICDTEDLINDERTINVTNAPDITPFLFAADAMISDYTSAMFDYCTLRRPCFIYAKDKDTYDRGFYWNLDQLPFPIASNSVSLVDNIDHFDKDKYNEKLDSFIKNDWGVFEDGNSCEALYEWIKKQ